MIDYHHEDEKRISSLPLTTAILPLLRESGKNNKVLHDSLRNYN